MTRQALRPRSELWLTSRIAASYRKALVEILDSWPQHEAPAIRLAWAKAKLAQHVERVALLQRQAE